MAILNGGFDFTGKMGNLSAYKRKDMDEVILRRKGGPSKKRVKEDPRLARTRENSTEFAACTKMTAGIRGAAHLVRHLGDTWFTGALNALSKKIQARDDTSDRGKRSVLLSRARELLTGFNFNMEYPFDQVVRSPAAVTVSREAASASVEIVKLTPGVQLRLPWEGTWFRFIVSVGVVEDVVFDEHGTATGGFLNDRMAYSVTEWYHAEAGSPEVKMDLQITEGIPASATALLMVGVEGGRLSRFGNIEGIPGKGAAKILGAF
jgi:hypothetical protein